jgi:hypothetical protein
MTPDPRWLAILKASTWQTLALTLAFGLFIALIPSFGGELPYWVWPTVALCFLVCASLSLASILSALLRFFPLNIWIVHWINIARQKREVTRYIPHMTEKEKEIIGYLLAKNQKTLVAAQDGGFAMTLISRAIIVRALAPGQVFYSDDMPMMIPDHIWDVLLRHKAVFPYTQPRAGKTEPHPWRKPYI